MVFTSLMNTMFTVHKKTQTKVGPRMKDSWTDSQQYFGRYDPSVATLTFLNSKTTYVKQNNFFCGAAVDVVEGDRLSFQNRTFDVISVVNPFNANHHLEILIEEIRSGS